MSKKFDSGYYWERRYKNGHSSGKGSYGRLAEFKADVLNIFVQKHGIQTVIEFGMGDGNQLELACYPQYVGYDVSQTAVELCKKKFESDNSKSFRLLSEYHGERADLALSLDVIFHLIEDKVFEDYMRRLCSAGSRYVVIYSSNSESLHAPAPHVKHRRFTDWIDTQASNLQLLGVIKNRFGNSVIDGGDTSPSDFYIYENPDVA